MMKGMLEVLCDESVPRAAALEKARAASSAGEHRVRGSAWAGGRFHMASPWESLDTLRRIEPTCVSRLRAAQTALLVELHALRTGAFPASLEDLSPDLRDAVPSDPNDGSSIEYEVLPTGYCTYSPHGNSGKHSDGEVWRFVVCRE